VKEDNCPEDSPLFPFRTRKTSPPLPLPIGSQEIGLSSSGVKSGGLPRYLLGRRTLPLKRPAASKPFLDSRNKKIRGDFSSFLFFLFFFCFCVLVFFFFFFFFLSFLSQEISAAAASAGDFEILDFLSLMVRDPPPPIVSDEKD